MKKDIANINLKTAISKKIPNKTQLVNFLTEILQIEKEAIYRRLRGEVAFTFSEVAIIAEQLGVSLDELIGLKSEKRKSLKLQLVDFTQPQEIDYQMIENYCHILEAFNQTGSFTIYETWDAIPFPLCYKFSGLTRFYLFKWAFQVNNDLTTTRFKEIQVEERFLKSAKSNLDLFLTASQTQLILADNIFENLIKDLQFFRNVHLVSIEDIQLLIHEMEECLSYLEELAYRGTYPETGKKVLLYISEIVMQTPYTLLEANGNYISILRALDLSGASTTDEDTYYYIKNWFSALKRLSTHISISGEKDRIRYFEKQRNILRSFKEEVGTKPEFTFA
ncbi:MAG: hypothetical protein LIP01_03675 [Tannerellaceae bacterium]|nr:hypothetical protein [Tannerellaceae bacterium]